MRPVQDANLQGVIGSKVVYEMDIQIGLFDRQFSRNPVRPFNDLLMVAFSFNQQLVIIAPVTVGFTITTPASNPTPE
jgi:hypothetical protein